MAARVTYDGGRFSCSFREGQPESAPLDKKVRCSVSGPEPGYIGTALMFTATARAVLENRAQVRNHHVAVV